MTTLLVTREGLEAVLYLGVRRCARRTRRRSSAVPLLVGAVLGFVAAGFFAWSWTRWGHRLNLGVILKVTSLFLGLFLLQLLVYGVHELAESGVIQGSQAFHDATELLGPDGSIGQCCRIRWCSRRCSTWCSPAWRSRITARRRGVGQRVGRRRA